MLPIIDKIVSNIDKRYLRAGTFSRDVFREVFVDSVRHKKLKQKINNKDLLTLLI